MKVIILAGGYGTRLSEFTEFIPKPMVTVGDKPILLHLMNIYSYFNHTDFYIALGYKSHIIKSYFLNYKLINSDFTININSGDIIEHHLNNKLNWNITLVDTATKL
jgi:glucose-1-phosphate cytidylyltransferase